MSSLLLLAACLLLGWLVARFGHPPATLAQNLNWWVINVALPALVLHLAPQIHFDAHLWFLIAALWFVFAGAWVFFSVLGRALHWTRARIGALILVCGLGNTSFIGFPLIEALHGQEGLTLAVLADQAGCFVVLSVGGTLVAALYSGHSVAPLTIARRVLLFPPFISLLVGVIAGACGGWPAVPDAVFDRIGATLVPMALFSVGLQFQLHLGRQQLPAIALGLSWKLLLAPLIVWTAGWLIGVEGLVLTIAVLQSAMAPMISATILASQNDLEPPLANTILGVGILLAFITVPLANHWLG
ncbi:MAG TPA: AEC family transporter [Povalibacter sp.]|uniref:AEC family transporter n=1 Tax=Povalibacter sp. TaxID=1962978 RepID=UPI002BF00785|nr:AEC family transporter [Povalibacter sp.]HMN46335.1 AEC family transporter [Povalibacter sp.]